MEKLPLRNKLLSLPKKTLLIFAAVGAILVIVILIAGLFLSRTAETNAQSFEKDLTSYIEKLTKAKNKFTDISSVASHPPQLKTVAFGSLNGLYKKAQAKQTVLNVYQDELFTPLTKYDKNNKFHDKALLAERSFTTTYNNEIYASSSKVNTTRYGDDFNAYKAAAQAFLDKKIALNKEYRESINKAESGEYGTRVKQFYINQIDNGIKSSETNLSKVKQASSFGQVRYQLVADKVDAELPELSVRYPLYAANAVYIYPYLLTSPAIASLTVTLGNVHSDDSEARLTAYRALYGSMIASNTPARNETDVNIGRKLGIAHYALYRLQTLLDGDKNLSDSSRSATRKKVADTKQAISDIGFGVDQTVLPAGIGRIVEYNTIVSDIAEYNGYSDSRMSYRSLFSNGKEIPGSSFSADRSKEIMKAADHILPSSYFTAEVAEYKKAMSTCTNARITYQQKSDNALKEDVALNKTILQHESKLKQLIKVKSPTSEQRKQLTQLKADLKAANQKFSDQDKIYLAASKEQSVVLRKCMPAAETAIKAIKAKSDNRPAHLKYIYETAQTIYR